MNSVDDWLAYLEALHPVKIDMGLDRVGQVLDRLEIPRQWPIPVIMLAGTNGKGTTGAALEAMAAAAGLKAGVYSSPHLLHYSERVRLNRTPITDAELCQAFAAVEQARAGISLSYFEFGTLAAFWYFWQQPLDLLVLEVGLGGRLDAVNLIDADLAVITNVDFDHQEFLGTSLDAIGREKAGILRPGRPALVGMREPPQSVLDRAQELGCPLKRWQQDFELSADGRYRAGAITLDGVQVPHLPRVNAALALTALLELAPRLPIPVDAMRQALAQVQLLGRMNLHTDGDCFWLLDVAHNPQSVRYLAEKVESFPARRKIAICSMLADKDIEASLLPVAGCFDGWWLAGLAIPRGLNAAALAARVPSLNAQLAETLASACQQARQQAEPGDLLVIFGSFHTVAAALACDALAWTQTRQQED